MTTKAIILKKQNTNEYDQWVTCYTEEFGKLKTVAKSILKPSSIQSLHLDIFNLVEFELINGRGMPIITGAQAINSFGGVKSSLAKTAVAYFFTEAIDKMVFENDKDEELWSFMVSFLGELSIMPPDGVMTLLRQGQTKLLNILGYFPETDSCRLCESKLDENNFGAFNHLLGGIICKKCFLSGHGGILISKEDFLLLVRDDSEGKASPFSSVGSGCGPRPIPSEARWNKNIGGEKKTMACLSTARRSVLDGMFEYIAGGKFYSLDLLAVVK